MHKENNWDMKDAEEFVYLETSIDKKCEEENEIRANMQINSVSLKLCN